MSESKDGEISRNSIKRSLGTPGSDGGAVYLRKAGVDYQLIARRCCSFLCGRLLPKGEQ